MDSNGDGQAQARLYRLLRERLLPEIVHWVSARGMLDPEDVLSETFLRVYPRVDRLDDVIRYARRVATSVVEEERRLRRRLETLSLSLSLSLSLARAQSSGGPERDALEWADLAKALKCRLTKAQAVLFERLFERDDRSHDIAHDWGVSTQAIRSRKARLIRKLRLYLENHGNDVRNT